MIQRGYSGDGCDLSSTLCTYDLRKGVYLFGNGATSEAENISSELKMCSGGVHSILLLSLWLDV